MRTRSIVVVVVGIIVLGPGLTFAQPPRVETGNTPFGSELRQLVSQPPLSTHATRAVAYHNDAEIWVNRELTLVVGAASCDEQRDFAAALWLRWSEMGVGPGAGVTIKSYTGRVIASAEEGFTGPRFHC